MELSSTGRLDRISRKIAPLTTSSSCEVEGGGDEAAEEDGGRESEEVLCVAAVSASSADVNAPDSYFVFKCNGRTEQKCSAKRDQLALSTAIRQADESGVKMVACS